jgi:hypothetical protein
MAKYVATCLCVNSKNGKKNVGVVLIDADTKSQALKKFWTGDYFVLIDNGGSVLSMTLAKVDDSETWVWGNV